MIARIKKLLVQQEFFPGVLGLFVNPFYFARKGLCENVRALAPRITGRVLDVGCGQKPYSSLFQVKEYVGMDIEQSGHDHRNEAIDVLYDGKVFPFDSGSFDSAVSNEVLEHVFNPDEHLSEISRVLKPGGMFLITVPFMWDEHEQPYDYARYTSFGLKHLLELNGFEIMEHRKSMSDIRAVFQMFGGYIYKKTLWMRRGRWSLAVTLLLNAPINLLGALLALILPSNLDLYLDNIILARKKEGAVNV